jgi:hypothetical protein
MADATPEEEAPEPIRREVAYSAGLEEACERFLDLIGAWTGRVREAYPDGYVSDSHDGGTFMLPWLAYMRARDDDAAWRFFAQYRDAARQHFEAAGQWRHGYWKRQEAHHGTEHFDLYLYALWLMDPGDGATVAQFEDAAEHIGNWAPGFPDWFDWQGGVFRSTYLGTEHVGEPEGNVPDHLRFASMALGAYEMTGRSRYLEFARVYGGRWADGIVDGPSLPVGLRADSAAYQQDVIPGTYAGFAGAAPKDLNREVLRAENLIASEAVSVLLRLRIRTGEKRFGKAVDRLLEVAAESLESPIAWQVHGNLRRYRSVTGSDRFDEAIASVAEGALRTVKTLTLDPVVEHAGGTSQMGMRGDLPEWTDEAGEPAPSPLLQTLVALTKEDDDLLTRAVDLGRTYLALGLEAYGDVAEHGCTSRAAHAVARGHGRLDGCGVVTECLGPALERRAGKKRAAGDEA